MSEVLEVDDAAVDEQEAALRGDASSWAAYGALLSIDGLGAEVVQRADRSLRRWRDDLTHAGAGLVELANGLRSAQAGLQVADAALSGKL